MDLRNPSKEKIGTRNHTAESAFPKETGGNVRIDPKANAALATAVAAAKRDRKPGAGPAAADAGRTTPDAPSAPPARKGYPHGALGRAALAAALVGSCWLASHAATLASRDSLERIGQVTARSEGALGELSGEIEALKNEVSHLRASARSAASAEEAYRAKLASTLGGLQASRVKPDEGSAALAAKLERMETQITAALAELAAQPSSKPSAKPPAESAAGPAMAAPEGPSAAPVPTETRNVPVAIPAALREPAAEPAPAPAPAAAVPLPPAKPARAESARTEPVNGWVVREVYDGAALVESQNRRLYEAVPGGFVPGIGRIEAIERRGRNWVVLTDRGIISTYR